MESWAGVKEIANAHGARRLDHDPAGGSEPVWLTFDGVEILGQASDTVATALLAAGVRVFRTMPRTGEARGGFCMVGTCSDCLMIIDGVPGVRACVTTLRDGLRVETQHGLGHWPDGDGA